MHTPITARRLRRAALVGALVVAGSSTVIAEPASAAVPAASLTVSDATPVYGQKIKFTATVPTAPKTTKATGTMVFAIDGTPGPTTTVTSGKTSLTTAALTVGDHEVVGDYSGDATHPAGSTNLVSVTVSTASTTTTLEGPATVASGQRVKLEALLARVAPSTTGSMAGTVAFSVDGGAPVIVNATNLRAKYSPLLPDGLHTIVASYSGNAGFSASTSAPIQVQVGPVAATPVLDQSNSGDLAEFGNVYEWRGRRARTEQTFTAGITGDLTQISVKAYPQFADTQDLIVTVQAVEAGVASGSPLASGRITADLAWPTRRPDGFNDVVLDQPVPVTAGTTYALVFDVPDTEGTRYWVVTTTSGDLYSRGEVFTVINQQYEPFEYGPGYDVEFETRVVPGGLPR